MTTMAELATTDLNHLDAFHALLPALAGALDVRDVFQHLSTVASRIVPHDEANLALATDDGTQYRLYASTREGGPELVCRESHGVLQEPMAARLMDAVPGPERGLQSGVCAPVFIGDAVVGVFALFSRRPQAYSPQDLGLVQRLAAYVAVGLSHQRLAEAARRAAVDRERTASIESSVELLRTISGVLDIRTVFPQVSEIAQKVLGHDLLTLMFHDRDGQILIEVASSDAFPELTRLIKSDDSRPKDDFIIIDDFRTATLSVVEPADLRERIVAAGYRSFLTVLTRARDQEMGLGFWSNESELFGYERGAFTGAQQSKAGQIELAASGVLFLDEVTEMSQSAQAKFLRVLQEREFQRLGGTRPIKANVRVIAATNRDLRKAVDQGRFREDLYYRLQVFEIAIPPLRDRKSDVLPLAEAFLQDIARSFGRPVPGLTADATRALLDHGWPGNVRELRNALERAAILCEGGLITAQHLLLPSEPQAATAGTTDLNVVERQTIEQVMRKAHGNKSKAAKHLGLTRTQLYGRLRKYGLPVVDS